MKKHLTISSTVCSLIFFSICACTPGGVAPSSIGNGNTNTSTPSDGSQTIAQLAGTGSFCTVDGGLGTALAGTGITKDLTLNTDGSYMYLAFFSDHTSGCQTAQNSGGNNIATYSQSGTFTVGGAEVGTSPIGTKITFTVSSAALVIYASGNAFAQGLANWMNSADGGGSGCSNLGSTFSTSSTSTLFTLANGVNCVGTLSGTYAGISLPAVGATFENIGYNGGSTLATGVRTNVWSPGASSFPSSYTETYLTW